MESDRAPGAPAEVLEDVAAERDAQDRIRGVQDGRAEHPLKDAGGRAEKLVRDRIPEIIRATGRSPEIRVAGPEEHGALLRAKLYEEAGEYAASGDPAELADLLEVVHALAALHGITPGELEERRSAKAAERGGFSDRLVLQFRG
ncbi:MULTISPECIES: hypothetical protein [unclassified Spirillospora]|uniref:hypothetical protein n=1 Tax=unclassified Spirillospora TaxID=2642701 RepID=UPI003715FEF0